MSVYEYQCPKCNSSKEFDEGAKHLMDKKCRNCGRMMKIVQHKRVKGKKKKCMK